MSITTNLVSWFELGEAAGTTRVDSTSTGNDLTDHATVGQGTGIVGNCATFVAASQQWLSHASNSSLQLGANGASDMSIACWFKISGSGDYVSKYNNTNVQEYERVISGGQITFQVWDASTQGICPATHLAAINDGNWH